MPLFSAAQELDGYTIPQSRGLGNHCLVDLFDCQRLPETPEQLEQHMLQVAQLIDATVVSSTFHQFNPVGLSGVVVIAESHIAVHTWPEHQTACVDFFTCSSDMNPIPGIRALMLEWSADSVSVEVVDRGRGPRA